jgi:precorrin-2 dehydrogenase/sirohydrochlorin ferrochelatase
VEPHFRGTQEASALLPIVLRQDAITAGLAGAGEGAARRKALLAEAGIEPVEVALDRPLPENLNVLFVAGLGPEISESLAVQARAAGILINVEDVPHLCDFHVPAAVRRGDLIITVSTGGKAPGLAKLIREWIEAKIGIEWSGRVREASQSRAKWRAAGEKPAEVSKRLRDYISERGWLS